MTNSAQMTDLLHTEVYIITEMFAENILNIRSELFIMKTMVLRYCCIVYEQKNFKQQKIMTFVTVNVHNMVVTLRYKGFIE